MSLHHALPARLVARCKPAAFSLSKPVTRPCVCRSAGNGTTSASHHHSNLNGHMTYEPGMGSVASTFGSSSAMGEFCWLPQYTPSGDHLSVAMPHFQFSHHHTDSIDEADGFPSNSTTLNTFSRLTQQQHVNNSSNVHHRPPKYKTVMLKVSGEALQGKCGFGVDSNVVKAVALEVAAAWRQGVRIAIVVGGGNYFRGANAWEGLDRATADYVGMLATVMNALQLQSALENQGVETRVQTAIEMREVAEPYIRRRAISHLDNGRVVIFGAGTGNPFFTTDTAAALRAAEMGAEVFLKATKVDGVYDSDPFKNPHAKRYQSLSYKKCTEESLQVMDETAVTLCKENNIPVIVFNIMEKGNILRAALGEPVGTIVSNAEDFSEGNSEL